MDRLLVSRAQPLPSQAVQATRLTIADLCLVLSPAIQILSWLLLLSSGWRWEKSSQATQCSDEVSGLAAAARICSGDRTWS